MTYFVADCMDDWVDVCVGERVAAALASTSMLSVMLSAPWNSLTTLSQFFTVASPDHFNTQK